MSEESHAVLPAVRWRSGILPLLAVLIGVLIIWTVNLNLAAKEATQDDAVAAAKSGGYRLLDTREFFNLYRKDVDNTRVVDTRTPAEYEAGHVWGAVNFPVETNWWGAGRFREALEKLLGSDENRVIVFYCAGLTPARSDAAARLAAQMGYTHVYRDAKGYPEWRAASLPITRGSGGAEAAASVPATSAGFAGWAMIWTLLGIFAGGLALNLTPCVYPLIPITVSYFSTRTGNSRPRLAAHGLLYLFGMACTNSLLGVTAALTGSMLGSALQSPIVLVGVAAVLMVFAASLFGLWEVRLPDRFTNAASRSYAGYFGSLFMGLTLGVVAAPCMGPFVLGLVTWVAGLGDPLKGFLIFFSLSLGLGLPLFFLALFSGSLDRLPRSGDWMLWVRKLMAWVMVGMAGYWIRPLMPEGAGMLLLAGIAVGAGLHLGWLDPVQANFRAFRVCRTAVGVVALAAALWLVAPVLTPKDGLAWQAYSTKAIEEAQKAGKPVILDFSANWCGICRELDANTFQHPDIVKRARAEFALVKVDLTTRGNPSHELLVAQYGVTGVPTVLFFNREGQELRQLRLVGYFSPEKFLTRMAEARRAFEAKAPPEDGGDSSVSAVAWRP